MNENEKENEIKSEIKSEIKNSQLFGSQIENLETENLDEKRSSEILNPHISNQKNEFMKPSYQVENPKLEKSPESKSLNPLMAASQASQISPSKSIIKEYEKSFERKKSNEEIMGEAYIERKKLSYNNIKKWDESKQHFLITHRNYMDNIILRLEKKIDFSVNSLQKLLKYFKDKMTHESEYCNFMKQKLPKIGDVFMETLPPKDPKQPPEKIMHFDIFTSNFLLHDEFQNKNIANLQQFIDFLDRVVCREFLGNTIQDIPKKVSAKKEKIITLRKQLQKVNVEVLEKSMKHSKLFNAMLEPNYQRSKKVKDLYNLELQFTSAANLQIDLHRKLGRETLNYWLELLKLQCDILGVIQKSFHAYISHVMKTYGTSPELEVSLKKFAELEYVKSAEEEFKIENIITKEESSFIRKYLKNEENKLSLADLEKFFEGFEITRNNEKPLVLKEISAERDVGGLTKKFNDCLIVFTVDNNILIFDDYKEEKGANFALKVEFVNIKEKIEKDVGFVEITEKLPGILFSSKQNFLIRMKTKNSYEEFVDYIKLIAKKGN